MHQELLQRIRVAWSGMSPPFRITGSDGDEPDLLAQAFAHKPEWESLSADFIDQAPEGYCSALSFFADEAYLYYLAAFLTADLNDELEHADVVFSLTHGLDDETKFKRVNPRRFGEQRWMDVKAASHAMFDSEQVSCIICYISYSAQCEVHEPAKNSIQQAIANYWQPRWNWLNHAKQ